MVMGNPPLAFEFELAQVSVNHRDCDDASIATSMIMAGVPLTEPYLWCYLSSLAKEERNGLESGRLPISDTFYLMGTSRLTDTLNPQEVFVVLEHGQIYGEVLAYRNPGLQFGDIHRLLAVPVKNLGDIIGNAKYEKSDASELPQEYLGILLHEQPNKYYMVIRGQRLIMEAESSMQTIMEKLQSHQLRVGFKFEGFQYQLGEFRLRVGKVVPFGSESLRGIVMEMEYLPISSVEISQLIMSELFDIWKEALEKRSLPGHFVRVEPKFSEYGLSDQYTSQHTAVQYADSLAHMIKLRDSLSLNLLERIELRFVVHIGGLSETASLLLPSRGSIGNNLATSFESAPSSTSSASRARMLVMHLQLLDSEKTVA
ncbi:Mediator of RNA polymerase II transcription subunit 20a [Capsicum annuum]|uniref:Multifunctional fusion protein n=1 Tax=Capsicum annuum TaxID=4072 RepID=A0A2G2YUF4_CAPAN|nr:Mediator of RNA polymerase II transcription subunit 20a [Capsicum annuum]